ncbi:hypothetical protein [Bacteriovorax sp. Seq25_V]|uniref:hypothetical protein n=1 Tax=Bacteriovorax sp. Seq25_V TaxID=1201288 RepID=UPI00038A539F|nr:hypothetical protein [Bacteriovorax sp. Seq25_V]EQC46840.1 hypothetical protein M900_2619 [Bacteriovorax sp. Seq25_V]
MKYFLILATIFSLSTFASDNKDAKKGEKFEAAKTKILAGMDERISSLTEGKACISAAKNREELKSCRAKMKEKMKGMKEKRQEHKKAMKKKMKEKKKESSQE